MSKQPKQIGPGVEQQETPARAAMRASEAVLHQETVARVQQQPGGLTSREVLDLQRSMGNQAVLQLLADRDVFPSKDRSEGRTSRVQPALRVGPVGDKYEQEADRMAQRAVEMSAREGKSPRFTRQEEERAQRHPWHAEEEELQRKPLGEAITPLVQRHPGHGEEERLHMKPAKSLAAAHVQRHPWHAEEEELQMMSEVQRTSDGGFQVNGDVEKRLQQKKGHGRPISDGLRKDMEGKFGADFSGVRIHTGRESVQLAQDIGARAFTHGHDIHFGADNYQPGSKSGRYLLAHELTHVVQQNPKTAQPKREIAFSATPAQRDDGPIQRKGFFNKLGKGANKVLQAGAGLLGGLGGLVGGALAGTGLGAYKMGKKGWNKGGNLFTKLLLAGAGGLGGLAGGSVYGAGVGAALGATRGWEGAKISGGTNRKEQELTDRFGVPVGKEGKHFNPSILKEVENTLESLPEGNVGGSWLRKGGIAPDTGTSALASFYTYDDKSISVGSPWWLPKSWHKNMRIGNKTAGIMDADQAAVTMDALDIKNRYPSQEDQGNGGLSIFRGVGDVHEGRKLLPYTIRHEMGHAIDHKIKFTKTRGRLKQFGGWKQHGGDKDERGTHDDENADAAVEHFMDMVGLHDVNLKSPDRVHTSVKTILGMVQSGLPLPANLDQHVTSQGNDPIGGQTVNLMRQAAKKLQKARNSPWMLNDGGAGVLEHNGRVFHLDHYGTWVSYDADARRNHGVSNYQFSSPGEWFAEAYAVYYEPERGVGDRGRNRLNQATKSWMNKNLGPHPGDEDHAGQRGELVEDHRGNQNPYDYWLTELGNVSQEKMAGLNQEGPGVDTPLPQDLQDVLEG